MEGESKAQKKVMAVHVIDALFLAGEDVRNLHFMERHRNIIYSFINSIETSKYQM